jgi:pyruvate kinase
VPGDSQAVSLTYRKLPEDVRAGDVLLLNDGALELRVEETSLQEVVCRVVVGGRLSSSKGINLPTRSIQAPGLTARDLEDLAFGIQEGVDYVALSFVRSAEDVREVKQRIRQHGADTPVIAKIEKHEVLDHIDAILEVADGIMVARGDLGVEIPIERVPVIQKMLIARANRAGKPVIVATQMLKSMEKNPRPTRAEVADIANAVWGGADATMLSEETAVGQHPVAAVRTMAQTAWNAEQELGQQAGTDQFEPRGSLEPQEAVAHGACRLAQDLDAAAILVCTQSGSTSRLVAKHRPDRPIVAITPSPATYRRLALIWGTWPLSMSAVSQQEEMEAEALARAVQAGLLRSGQRVVLTAGIPLYVPGTTNSIKVLTVP